MRRARLGAVGSWVLWGLAAGHLVEAVVLRRRLRHIPAVVGARVGERRAATRAQEKVTVLAAGQADVEGTTLAAAARTLDGDGLAAVDLVPGDLPADRALRLLRRVDPRRLRSDPLYSPGGANEVVVLEPGLAARLGTPGRRALARDELVRWSARAQRYAPTAVELRIAPSLRARPYGPEDRWRELEELTAFARPHGPLGAALLGAETAHLAALSAGLLVAPAAAFAALVTWSAQPALVFAGRSRLASPSLRPPDLARACLGRLVHGWRDNARTTIAGYRRRRAEQQERRRGPLPVTPPVDLLFEPRRSTCPWCASGALVGRLDVGDLLQHKPGAFHLDECADCGHVFQNPALSSAGLDHYYDQFYDGFGEESWDHGFSAMGPAYQRRVDAVARLGAVPRTWLDVGTGHGHFCLVARRRWPDARFDGVDMSAAVEEAERREWIDRGHRGQFVELARGGLARSYDVVSMHHYLEHTRDPRRELAAAATVLQPGGHLMIEMPDPASPWSRRLGRYWWQWGQPQHQHFVTCEAMVAALEGAGFEVLSVERGEATFGGELFNAVGLVLQRLARSPHLPWLPAPSLAHRVARPVLFAAALPVMAATKVADGLKDARLRRPGSRTAGNAYRLIARRI
jgi:SAM-dependent methyltransferase